MKKKIPNNLHIKFWRNNIFLNLTTYSGKLIFKCSCGYIKSEKQKNLKWSLVYLLKYLKRKAKLRGNMFINLALEGAFNSTRINSIYRKLLNVQFIIVFVRCDNIYSRISELILFKKRD